jgi:hypothetical protein
VSVAGQHEREAEIADERRGSVGRAPRGGERSLRSALWALLGTLAIMLMLAVASQYLVVQHSVNAQLGFDYATPRMSWHEERFVITRVDPGGAMALAGLRVDDQVQLDDVSELYALLIRGQGGTASIPVTRDGRARTVVARVPRMKLPLSPGLRRLMYGGYWAERRGMPRSVGG